MTTTSDDEAPARRLRELEESLLEPQVRKSERLVELLDDSFVEFGSSGRVYTKADLVETLQAEAPTLQTTSAFKVTMLAPQVALLTYRIQNESANPPAFTLRSSVWQVKAGRWRMVFHQATRTSAPQ